ncbi:MAG: hypothetical protein R3221_06860, partial [Spongiibacter sp.]|nr:hypothetical protein [Spongiibacter sp.]
MNCAKNKQFKLKLLAAGIVSAGALVGCSDSGSATPPKPIDPSRFYIQMVDEEGVPLTAGTISIKNADGTDTSGDATRFSSLENDIAATTYDVSQFPFGVASLNLVSSSPLVSEDDLDVVFVGSAPNYISSSAKRVFTESGTETIEITLVSDTPATTASVSTSKTTTAPAAGGNAPNTPITAATAPRAAAPGTAEVKGTTALTIPAGTKLRKSNGA